MSDFNANPERATDYYVLNPDQEVTFDGESIVVRTARANYVLAEPDLWPFITEVLKTRDPITTDPRVLGSVSETDRMRLRKALKLLEDIGILVSERGDYPSSVISMSNRGGGLIQREEILQRLNNATISIFGDEESFLIKEILKYFSYYPVQSPVVTAELPGTDDHYDIVLVAANNLFDPILDTVSTQLGDSDVRVWAPLTPATGASFTVGPWYYPGKSACHTCFRLRRASTEREPASSAHFVQGVSTTTTVDRALAQPALTSMLAAMVTDAAIHHVGLDGAAGQLKPSGFTTVSKDIEGFNLEEHSVLRVPRCPTCSQASDTGYPQIWFHEE